jgi:hypothetical protein
MQAPPLSQVATISAGSTVAAATAVFLYLFRIEKAVQ